MKKIILSLLLISNIGFAQKSIFVKDTIKDFGILSYQRLSDGHYWIKSDRISKGNNETADSLRFGKYLQSQVGPFIKYFYERKEEELGYYRDEYERIKELKPTFEDFIEFVSRKENK